MSRLRGQLLARALQSHCRSNVGPSEATGVLHSLLGAEHDVRALQSNQSLREPDASIFAAQPDRTPSQIGTPTGDPGKPSSSSFSLRASTHESFSSQQRAGGFLQPDGSQTYCSLPKDSSVLIRRPSFSPTSNIAGSNITVARALLRDHLTVPSSIAGANITVGRSLLREHLTVPSRSFSSSADATPAPVSSPLLTSLSEAAARPLGSGKGERTVRAKLTGIKQGVLKMNLVATLVRGMTVEDALNQLAVTPKRAAKTVSKVVHAAKSNAVQNHRLDEGRLIVVEAFVGKGLFLKRMNPHGRGKSGVKVRQRSQLTVVVREMSEEEASRRQQAKARGSTWRKKLTALTRKQLVPHKVVHLGQQGTSVKEADSAVQQA